MDAFTRRVELEDNDEVTQMAQSPPPPGSDAAVGNNDDDGAQNTLDDDDQVVPGQEHLETPTRRRRPFYEGASKSHIAEGIQTRILHFHPSWPQSNPIVLVKPRRSARAIQKLSWGL